MRRLIVPILGVLGLLVGLLVCSLVHAAGNCVGNPHVQFTVLTLDGSHQEVLNWPIDEYPATALGSFITNNTNDFAESWNLPDGVGGQGSVINDLAYSSQYNGDIVTGWYAAPQATFQHASIFPPLILPPNGWSTNEPNTNFAFFLIDGAPYNKGLRTYYADCLTGHLVEQNELISCSPQPGNIMPLPGDFRATNLYNHNLNKMWVAGSTCPTNQQLASYHFSDCNGEGCNGSMNSFWQTDNTMQFKFFDGTAACAVFTNGQAGSDQLRQRDTGVKGILLVDNQENWAIFQHNTTTTTHHCDRTTNPNFCIYQSDCSTPLTHTFISTFNYNDPHHSPYVGSYKQSGTCSGSSCTDACAAIGCVSGCYPHSNWPATVGANGVVCSSQLYTTGGSGPPYFGITAPSWINTLLDPDINPNAVGRGMFNSTNDPLGVAPAL